MDYVYYSDHLEHHGILGMKWGIRRYQNEDGSYTKEGLERRKNGEWTAKDYQKRLRQLDKRMQVDTQFGAASRLKANYIDKKRKHDGSEKDAKAGAKQDRYNKQADILEKDYNNTIKEFNELLKEVESNGMIWKNTKTNFNERYVGHAKDLVKRESGQKFKNITYIGMSDDVVNASSGNRITVRDASKASDKKKERYSRNQSLQSYRPQQVYYV